MSKQKDKPLNILIIDDDIRYVEALNRKAQKSRILLKRAGSLEEAKELHESKEGKSISGIILDVVCMKEKKQEVAQPNFIMEAIEYFQRHEKYGYLPIAVLTGEPDKYKNLKEYFEGKWPVYSKNRDENEMLSFLKEKTKGLEREKIIKQYPEVFEVIGKHLDIEAEEELISCLRNMNSSDFTVIKNNLACLRRLQEKIYIALNKLNDKIVPIECIEKGVKVREILRHLTEKGYVKKYTIPDSFGWTSYTIASDNGAHTPYQNPEYHPTKYTVQAVTYALMDLLLWLKEVATKRGGNG